MLSRVADACFWLSRYMERAETNARILDVNIQLMLDFEEQNGGTIQQHWQPILATLEDQELFSEIHTGISGDAVMAFVTFEKSNPNSILSCVSVARENARTVREQISSEMWEQLNRLYLFLHSPAARSAFIESPIDFYRSLVDSLHSFQGITDATMTHGEGWEFLRAGKFCERADSTSRVLDIKYHILLPSGEQIGGTLDVTQWMAVLRSCSAMEAFLKISRGQVTSWQVAEFLILHDSFPRSIRFCVDGLDQALHNISGTDRGHFSNEAERLSGLLRSNLDYTTIKDIFDRGLHQYLDGIQLRLTEISNALVSKYCTWLESTQRQSQTS
ncbi:MAG: alpha-E domain-containing protein [Terrimicrobiaceae bacterium]|nr:alpha-E domain-containing protein [Terrimicrobiaceae bacterium]